MQTTFSRGGHVLLTADQHLDLVAYLLQPIKHLFVPVNKCQDGIGDARIGAKLLHHGLRFSQVVSGDARKQMVNGLELQTAVDKVQPSRAVYIQGSAQLTLRKRFLLAQVGCRHAPVRQGDLHMQRHGDDVGDQDESDADGPCRQRAPEEEIAVQKPVAGYEAYLGRANPPRLAASKGGRSPRHDMDPREKVKVESSDAHDGIIKVLLIRNNNLGSLVPHIGELIVSGAKGFEEGRAGGKKRDVLDIGVVFLCNLTH